jgi:hypothetical protein
MAMTYEELHGKNIAELREIAKGINHEAVQGYTQMNKEHLLPAICQALGIDARAHHHLVSGINKAQLKQRMRALKGQREKALASGDAQMLHDVRRQLHTLNHRIRTHTR